jgi:hypothetical protein
MEKAEILKVRLDNLQRRFDAALSQIAEVIGDPTLTDREKIEKIDGLLRAEGGK